MLNFDRLLERGPYRQKHILTELTFSSLRATTPELDTAVVTFLDLKMKIVLALLLALVMVLPSTGAGPSAVGKLSS